MLSSHEKNNPSKKVFIKKIYFGQNKLKARKNSPISLDDTVGTGYFWPFYE
jgi:hypothetical protein